MKTRLLILLLSVALAVTCLPLSSSATDIYHLGDDTQLVDMGTSTVLAADEPVLFQSLASVSPYSTTSPTYWSANDISNALKYLQNISGYTSKLGDTNTWLNAISTRIGTSNEYLKTLDKLYSQFVYSSSSSSSSFANSLHFWMNNWFTWQKSSFETLNTTLTDFGDDFGFPENSSFYKGKSDGVFWNNYQVASGSGSGRKRVDINWYQAMNYILRGLSFENLNGSYPVLHTSGVTIEEKSDVSLVHGTLSGFSGLASILRGPSGNHIGGSILTQSYFEDGSAPQTYDANNLLSALLPLFSIQNDLARLSFVQADSTTVELKKSQQENEQAVKDNFTGDKGVNANDIGSMSGMGDSLGSFTDTGVTMDDGFTQLNNGDTWNFFSQEVAGQLNTVPATYAQDEDFIHFYDPENKAFQELLERVRGGK